LRGPTHFARKWADTSTGHLCMQDELSALARDGGERAEPSVWQVTFDAFQTENSAGNDIPVGRGLSVAGLAQLGVEPVCMQKDEPGVARSPSLARSQPRSVRHNLEPWISPLNNVAVATIVAKPYLSFARALADSFRRIHPDIPFVVLLADETGGYFDPSGESFQVLRLAELGVPRLERFRFQHGQQPLTYASTPFLLAHLTRSGFDRVVFIKQESLVLGDLTPLFDILRRASIVLTPHLVSPLTRADRIERELNILQSGTFNVGILGVAATAVAGRFLAWWQDRVHAHCRHAVADGWHYEQRWLDLVPGFFEDVHVLRDPAFNVGHWNLPERVISIDGERVLVNGQPCRLFRFSGYDPERPRSLTRYSSRLTAQNAGPAFHLFDRFRAALERHGYHETKSWPFAYGTFDNGAPVPDVARSLFAEMGDAVDRFGDPLHTGPGSYFAWLNEGIDDAPERPRAVTRLWHAVYRARPDLQRAFPDVLGADRDAFLAWTASSGIGEHQLSEHFLVPAAANG